MHHKEKDDIFISINISDLCLTKDNQESEKISYKLGKDFCTCITSKSMRKKAN